MLVPQIGYNTLIIELSQVFFVYHLYLYLPPPSHSDTHLIFDFLWHCRNAYSRRGVQGPRPVRGLGPRGGRSGRGSHGHRDTLLYHQGRLR